MLTRLIRVIHFYSQKQKQERNNWELLRKSAIQLTFYNEMSQILNAYKQLTQLSIIII